MPSPHGSVVAVGMQMFTVDMTSSPLMSLEGVLEDVSLTALWDWASANQRRRDGVSLFI